MNIDKKFTVWLLVESCIYTHHYIVHCSHLYPSTSFTICCLVMHPWTSWGSYIQRAIFSPFFILLTLSCAFVNQNADADSKLETESNYQAWIAFAGIPVLRLCFKRMKFYVLAYKYTYPLGLHQTLCSIFPEVFNSSLYCKEVSWAYSHFFSFNIFVYAIFKV